MKWSVVPIGKVCLETGQRDPGSKPDTPFRYVDLSTIDRESKRIVSAAEIKGIHAPSRARKEIRTGDVLVSTVRPNLNAVATVPEDLDGEIASTGLCVLRADRNHVHPRFLFYRVRCDDFVQFLVDRVTGANYPAVSDRVVKAAPLPLPPLDEQERIFRILDEAEELRKLRTQADRRTGDLTSAIFHDMFGDPAMNPKGWNTTTMGELTSFITSGSRGWAKYYSNEGAKFIRVQNLTGHQLTFDDIAYVSPPDNAESKRTKVHSNDLLVTITGVVGLVAIAHPSIGDAYVSQHVAIVRLRDGIDVTFAAAFLSDPAGGQRQIAEFQYGQTKPGLNLNQIRSIQIYLPPLSLQRDFSVRVAAIRAMEAQQAESRLRLDDLFQSLLHRAFAGQL